MKLHYGCGMIVGPNWFNCDASPTLRLQRLPIAGLLFKNLVEPRFPSEVKFGDIVAGLPIEPASCDAIYCSHVLEHLTLQDFRKALRNTHSYLKPGCAFRLIVPDFELQVKAYLSDPSPEAICNFLVYTHLGRMSRPRGLIELLRSHFGNSHHLWMWDYKGMVRELTAAGFIQIKRYQYSDNGRADFLEVEIPDRFEYSLALECTRN